MKIDHLVLLVFCCFATVVAPAVLLYMIMILICYILNIQKSKRV